MLNHDTFGNGNLILAYNVYVLFLFEILLWDLQKKHSFKFGKLKIFAENYAN